MEVSFVLKHQVATQPPPPPPTTTTNLLSTTRPHISLAIAIATATAPPYRRPLYLRYYHFIIATFTPRPAICCMPVAWYRSASLLCNQHSTLAGLGRLGAIVQYRNYDQLTIAHYHLGSHRAVLVGRSDL
jgi:hypothetical protein